MPTELQDDLTYPVWVGSGTKRLIEMSGAEIKRRLANENPQKRIAELERMGEAYLQQLTDLDELREQLAAAQATIVQMREMAARYLKDNDTEGFGCACVPDVDYTCGPCRTHQRQQTIRNMLALPADRTALDAMIEREKERAYKPAIEKARREGMLEAAEIAEECDQEYEPYVGTPRPLNYTCADAIRQAAERSE